MGFDPISYGLAHATAQRIAAPRPDTILAVALTHGEDPTALINAALRRGYEFVWLSEVHDAMNGRGTLPPKPAIFTDDDARLETFTTFHPVIEAFGIKANLFVPSGFIDGEPGVESLPGLTPMTWEQLRAMQATGLYEFGNHTRLHKNLISQPDEDRLDDLVWCQERITAELGVTPLAVAYPAGRYNAATVRDCRAAGLSLGFTTQGHTWVNTSYFSTVSEHPFGINRAEALDNTWLKWALDTALYDFRHDLLGERNYGNALGYWNVPAGGSFDGAFQGASIKLDSRNVDTEHAFQSADLLRVIPGEPVYYAFSSLTELQTAGKAQVRLAQYGFDGAPLAPLVVKEYTATEALTTSEGTARLHEDCHFVRVELHCDADMNGLAHMRYAKFMRGLA